MALVELVARRIDSVRRLQTDLEFAQVFVLVQSTYNKVVTGYRSRKFVRLVIIRLVRRTRPSNMEARRPGGIRQIQLRRSNIVSKMEINTLNRSRPSARIMAIDGDQQTIANFDIILNILGQVYCIESSLSLRRIIENIRSLFQFFVIDRFGRIPHDIRVHPQIDLFETVNIYRITEAHHKTVGPAIGVLGTLPQHRQFRNFAVKQEFRLAIVIGTCRKNGHQDNRYRR